MKILSRIIFTIIYVLTVALIIYLPTRERHFQGEIVNIVFVEDEEFDFLFDSGQDISLTIRDSNGKQYVVLVGYNIDLKIGDYVKGTYDNTFLGNIKYAKEINLIAK